MDELELRVAALEVVMTANLLLRIVDSRATRRAMAPPRS